MSPSRLMVFLFHKCSHLRHGLFARKGRPKPELFSSKPRQWEITDEPSSTSAYWWLDQRIVYLTPGVPTLIYSFPLHEAFFCKSPFIERKLAEERVSTIRKGIPGTATMSLRLCCSESRNFLHS